MKKLFLRIIIFLLILGILFMKLNNYILPLEINRTTIKMGLNYRASIYFIGNSHSYWAYNPLIIENETKNLVYNISTSSQSLEASYFLAKYLMQKKETKFIFFELFHHEISDKKIDARERIVFDYFPLSFKIHVMKYFYEDKINILKNIFNFNLHHNFWKNKDFLKRKLKFDGLNLYYSKDFTPFNGYVPHFNRNPSYEENEYKNIPENFFEKDLNVINEREVPKENLDIIIKLLEEAKQKNKTIVFLLSPFYFQDISSQESSEYINFLKPLIKQYDFELINFNEIYSKINLKREDFKDSGHLNYWGANKLSFYLSNYLLTRYHIQSSINFIKNKKKLYQNKEILSILEKYSEKNIIY